MKSDQPPSDWHTITDPAVARALCALPLRAVLGALLDGEKNVSALAQELGQDKNAVLLKVRRLVRLGLVAVEREEKRAGRAIKHYRAVAPGFFVPFHLTPYPTPEAWMHAEYAGRERLLNTQTVQAAQHWQGGAVPQFGLRLFRRTDGITEADFAFDMQHPADLNEADAPAVMSAFILTTLSRAEAKQLQAELHELVRRYERKSEGVGYILRLGLAPA